MLVICVSLLKHSILVLLYVFSLQLSVFGTAKYFTWKFKTEYNMQHDRQQIFCVHFNDILMGI